jgi:GTP:adenosylcobinamide-phosphate guanylyltransferase
MDAMVTAGGIPQPGEPLYEYTRGGYKALLDVAGKPMVQWALDALSEAKTVDRVVLVGLNEDSGLKCAKPLAFIPNHGDMLDNIRAGVVKVKELNPSAHHILAVSSDIPGIKPEMVDWVVNTAMETDHDVYYCVITRQVMETRYPGSNRSYTHLKDGEFCGGDINVIRAATVLGEDSMWQKIIASRKNALKQAALIGFDTLFLVVTHLIDVKSAEKLVSKRLHVKGRVIVSPYAEVGMDVDKPHQLEIMRADLARQQVG